MKFSVDFWLVLAFVLICAVGSVPIVFVGIEAKARNQELAQLTNERNFYRNQMLVCKNQLKEIRRYNDDLDAVLRRHRVRQFWQNFE